MPYPRLSFIEAQDRPSTDFAGKVLPVEWDLGGVCPPNVQPDWSQPMPAEEARDHLKGLVANVKGAGRLLARWRYASGATVQVMLLLFRRRLPSGSTEKPPDWFKPRPTIYDRLRGKEFI